MGQSNMKLRMENDNLKRQLAELQEKLAEEKQKVPTLQEAAKTERTKAQMAEKRLADAKAETVKIEASLKTIKSQMGSGQAALIERLNLAKKTLAQEAQTVSTLKQTNEQLRTGKKDLEKQRNDMTIKYRTQSASVFKLEQEVDKHKTAYEQLKREHDRLQDKYVDAKSKRELAEGRLKDASEKHLSCTEAMRRMKTYNEDTVSEQRMKIERLSQTLGLEKEKLQSAEMSRDEVSKATKVAQNAASNAANQAVLTNQLQQEKKSAQKPSRGLENII